jgi:hypothetical protein
LYFKLIYDFNVDVVNLCYHIFYRMFNVAGNGIVDGPGVMELGGL